MMYPHPSRRALALGLGLLPLFGRPSWPRDPAGHVEAATLLSIDVNAARRRLPPSLGEMLDTIAEEGSVTGAQRAGTQPAASFYRALRQLRLRLIAAGLKPPAVNVAASN